MIVYRILNQINGMAYIGKSESTFQSRYGTNWINAATNNYLRTSLKVDGQDNFKMDILAEVNNANLLEDLEKHFIRLHNTVYPHGFNLSWGGKRTNHVDDTKKRISKRLKEIPLHHRGKFEKGLTVNCRICHKEYYTYLTRGMPNNTTCSKECSSKIYSVKIEAVPIASGETLIFKSAAEAEKFGFYSGSISRCIKGKRKTHKGYSWRRI